MKKFSRLLFPAVIGIALAFLGIWGYYRRLSVCLKPDNVELVRYCFQQAEKLEPIIKLASRLSRNPELTATARLLTAAKPFLGYEDYFLGIGRPAPTTYLVLLQNDTELRPNGGFFGSYAVISVQSGKPEVRFQDIYVPDGQLAGHVDPPPPIQAAFKQGWWKLRDADWYPDFPSSATTIRWFFTQGKEIDPDFLLTLNLTTIKQILSLTGPIEIPEYDLIVDSANVYQFLQTEAEDGFFPGSTQKKDALAAVGRAFVTKLVGLDYTRKLAIANLLLDQLEQQNLLLHTHESPIQDILLAKNWAGQLTPPATPPDTLGDAVAVVEANLGANKANCCVSRLATHEISFQNDYLVHKLKLVYTNSAYEENPVKPNFYGGNYIQYLRLYLPQAAVFVAVAAQPSLPTTLSSYPEPYAGNKSLLAETEAFGFKEIGFFHITRAGSQSQIELSYSLPRGTNSQYQLTLLKQHGLANSPQVVYFAGRQWQTELTHDFQLVEALP